MTHELSKFTKAWCNLIIHVKGIGSNNLILIGWEGAVFFKLAIEIARRKKEERFFQLFAI
jgi:hypothetical protein